MYVHNPLLTMAKLTLSGGLVWTAKKTGYGPVSPDALQPSHAVLVGPDDWCADCGGFISATDPSAHWSSRTDQGSSYDAGVDSSTASVTSPRRADYRHWCRSVDESSGDVFIWGQPIGAMTYPNSMILPATDDQKNHLCQFDEAAGDCLATMAVNYAQRSNVGSTVYVNDGFCSDGNLTSRRSLVPNNAGGFLHGYWREQDTFAEYQWRTCGYVSYRSNGTVLVSRGIQYPNSEQGFQFVRHGESEIAYLKLGSTDGSGHFTGGYVSVGIDSVNANTQRAYCRIAAGASGSSVAPELYRADSIDSNGTNVATRIPAQKQVFLLDNDLTLLWSYTDADSDNWGVNHLMVAGDDAVYHFSSISGIWHAVKFTSAGVAWRTPLHVSSAFTPAMRIYEAREHDGSLYVSGELEDADGNLNHIMALDADTGDIQWKRQIVDQSAPGWGGFGGAEFEIVDDHILLAVNGKLKFL